MGPMDFTKLSMLIHAVIFISNTTLLLATTSTSFLSSCTHGIGLLQGRADTRGCQPLVGGWGVKVAEVCRGLLELHLCFVL